MFFIIDVKELNVVHFSGMGSLLQKFNLNSLEGTEQDGTEEISVSFSEAK